MPGRKHSNGVLANSLHRVSKRAWDSETLPQGDDKVTAVRQMFDAIAPRYDLVNRIMTFRLDVHWRRKAVKLLALPPAQHGDRPRQRNRRPVRRPGPCRSSPAVVRPQLRHAGRRPQRGATGASRHLAAAATRPLRRWRDVWVRAAQPRRAAEVLRRARPRGAPRRADRAARRRRAAQQGDPLGQQHLLRQGRPEDRQPAERRRGVPLPAQERRLPALTRADAGRPPTQPASPTPSTTNCPAGSPSSCSAHGASTCAPSVDRSIAKSTSTTSPAATATCSSATASGSRRRGVAARVPIDDVASVLAAIDHDDHADGARPLATRRGAVQTRRAVRARRPGDGRRQGRRRSPMGDHHRRCSVRSSTRRRGRSLARRASRRNH